MPAPHSAASSPASNNPRGPCDALGAKLKAAQVERERLVEVDTTALEREIDQRVYQLYGLTPEEIASVEASTRAK